MPRVELELRAQIANLNTRLEQTEKQLKDIGKQSDKTSKTIQSNMSKTDSVVQKFGNTLKAVITIGALVQFTKAIINVRKEFEKYEAVLTNTLGSHQAARKEMQMLQEFAAKTPFSLQELTGAYVKLVNYGLKPTEAELRRLGDLASSVGKGFDQLTEAVADAVVGEFERLKEFGIKARKEGDKITFTFKEISTTVQNTSTDIKNYILSLGDLEGVSGAMASISATLEGQISNLGDSFDRLLNILGEKSSGVFSFIIGRLNDMLEMIIELNEASMGITELGKQTLKDFMESYKELSRDDAIQKITEDINYLNESYQKYSETADRASRKQRDTYQRLASDYLYVRNQLSLYLDELIKVNDETDKGAGKVDEKELKRRHKQMLDNLSETAKLELEEDQETWNAAIAMYEQYQKTVEETNAYELQLEEEKNAQLKLLSDERNQMTEDELNKWQLAQELKKNAAVNAAMETLNFISQVNRTWYEAELAAAGDSEEKKEQIRKRYARREKATAISKAIISGALAILKNTEELGTIFAQPVNVWQAIITAAQIATIAAQKFSKGVIDLSGPGSGTSDSIPSMLSRGESVMTANETKRFKPWLQSMRDNTFPVVGLEIAKALEKGAVTNNLNYDNSKEIKELRMIREELKKRPFSSTYYENGKKIIKKGNITTRISLN